VLAYSPAQAPTCRRPPLARVKDSGEGLRIYSAKDAILADVAGGYSSSQSRPSGSSSAGRIRHPLSCLQRRPLLLCLDEAARFPWLRFSCGRT